MHTLINNPARDFHLNHGYFNDDKNANDIKFVDYSIDNKIGQIEITLFSELFIDSELKISLRQDKITMIISEIVRPQLHNSVFVTDWQSYKLQPYIRMRNVSLMLPGDNFILIRYYVIPEEYLLKIILRQAMEN